MQSDELSRKPLPTPARHSGCGEHNRLLDDFGVAVRELLELHEQQWGAIIEGDNDSYRFDVLIHMANEKKQSAKYAYLRHVEAHGCSDFNALNQTRA
ncbi:MAG: hypothetical protein JWO19_1952 [Bryobacterales bacterium]|nr:hypothetical protein [Bryobacterales bacterium]